MITEELFHRIIKENGIENPLFFIYRGKDESRHKPFVVTVIANDSLKDSHLPYIWDDFEIFMDTQIPGLIRYIHEEITSDEISFNIIKVQNHLVYEKEVQQKAGAFQGLVHNGVTSF